MAERRAWQDDEPTLQRMLIELKRLKRRALARPWKALLLALLMTAALVGLRARKQGSFSAKVIFRLVAADAYATPMPAGALRSYVQTVCFSNTRLLALIKEHGLYLDKLSPDPLIAVEAMRDDLQLEVRPGRAARLILTFAAHDAQTALWVAHQLAQLVGQMELKERIRTTEESALRAEADLTAAREQLARNQSQIASSQLQLKRAAAPHDGLLRAEIANLGRSIAPLQKRQKELAQQVAVERQRAATDRAALGLNFDLIDQGPQTTARSAHSGWPSLLLFGLMCLALFLPLTGLFAAAWDARVFDADDVRRLGLVALGHVHSFPGDNTGSLDSRLPRRHGVD